MTAKQYLKQYEIADRKVRRLREEYEAQMEMIDAVRSNTDFDGLPKSRSKSAIEDKIFHLADKAAELKAAEIDAIRVRQNVFSIIIEVPGIEGDILQERYINLKRWDEIAMEKHYSYRNVMYYHRKALHLVEGIIFS